MTDSAATPDDRPIPVYLRTPADRYAHVAMRLKERAGIEWTVERVQILEKKIKAVRHQIAQNKPVAPILPLKLAESEDGHAHYYRVLINGEPVTFVWSDRCKGLVSFAGRGEILSAIVATVSPPSP